MFAVFWKEVKSYFNSPVAYVLIGLFTVLTSIYFVFGNLLSQSGDFTRVISNCIVFLIFIIPVLTMRILAEDRKNGTEILLITSPASLTSIVFGKFLASYFVFIILTAVTFIYPLILLAFGGKITAALLLSYLAFLLLGGAYISVGVFASSLTESQVIAAIVGIISLFVMFIADSIGNSVGGFVAKILHWFSLTTRYDDLNSGVFSLSPIVYYLSFIAVFLFLAVRVIEKRRWSQG